MGESMKSRISMFMFLGVLLIVSVGTAIGQNSISCLDVANDTTPNPSHLDKVCKTVINGRVSYSRQLVDGANVFVGDISSADAAALLDLHTNFTKATVCLHDADSNLHGKKRKAAMEQCRTDFENYTKSHTTN